MLKLAQSLSAKIKLSIKQTKALAVLFDKVTRELLYGGGAGGGKSFLGCIWITTVALKYPGTRWFIGRKNFTALKRSTLLTLWDVFRLFGLKAGVHYKYNGQDNVITIYNDTTIYLLDLDHYPGDPNYDRLGSSEYTGGFVDEANQITARCKDVLISRIRYMLEKYGLIPKLLMSCNPAKNWVYSDYYKPNRDHKLPKDKKFIQALVTDNPFISVAYLTSLRNLKDKTMRERLLKGNWEYDDDPSALFTIDIISDLFTNPIDPSADKYMTCDVARFGDDKTIMMIWHGFEVIKIYEYSKIPTDGVVKLLQELADKNQIPRSHVIVDEAGVGGGVVDQFKCRGFIGASAPYSDPDYKALPENERFKVNYQNLRSQCFYMFAEYAQKRMIRINITDAEQIQKITEDLEQIKAKDADKDGKLKIIAKEDIKLDLGRSPDYADALSMRMLLEVDKPLVPGIF